MSRIWAIARRIWSQFVHDPRTLALLFVAPLVVLWLLSVLLVSDTYSPKIATVDLPEGFEQVLREQDAQISTVSADEATRMLDDGEIDAILSMQADSTTLNVLYEGSNSSKNSAVMRVVSDTTSDFSESSRAELESYIENKKVEIEQKRIEMEQKRDEIRQTIEDAKNQAAWQQEQMQAKLSSLAATIPNFDASALSIGSSSIDNLMGDVDIDSLGFDETDFDFDIDMAKFMPVQDIETQYLHGSSDWDMFDFYGPIFIGLFLFIFVFITCSFSLVNERASGTMERFLDTPVRPAQILAGYALGFGAMSLIQAAIILTFGLGVIGFPNEGSIMLVVLIAVSLAVASVTLGLLVSGLATAAFQVVQLMLLFVVPQILLCGLFDLSASPEWLQVISRCLPLTYGVDAMRQVMLAGAGFGDIWVDLCVIWGFIVIFFVLAALGFRKKRARRQVVSVE